MLKVYGASDDLLEIEGPSKHLAEFNVYLDKATDTRTLTFSDGTELEVRYDNDGIWRFAVVRAPGCVVEKTERPAEAEDDGRNISDMILLMGDPEPITWVRLGNEEPTPLGG